MSNNYAKFPIWYQIKDRETKSEIQKIVVMLYNSPGSIGGAARRMHVGWALLQELDKITANMEHTNIDTVLRQLAAIEKEVRKL